MRSTLIGGGADDPSWRVASRLGVGLARIAVPVLEHQWRLLLPERHRYRWAAGDLAPVPPAAASLVVTGHEPTPVPSPSPASSPGFDVTGSIAGGSGLAGTVFDDAGAAVPGVTVTLYVPTGGTRAAVTNADGRFEVLALAPGSYLVVAELEGFQTVRGRATVAAGRVARLEMRLPLAEFVEEIVVTSSAGSVAAAVSPWRSTETILTSSRDAARPGVSC